MSELPRQFGPYSLLKLLAKGGMGEIYLARTAGISHFEKYYAVKKLLKKFAHDADVCARFIDEAKLGARLQHPNIVQVYDLGKVTDELFMATEFVDGFDLRRVLRFCHEKRKRIPLDIALFIVREVLSGLAYAHRQVDAEGQSINLIHRDISPQNVLVSFEGEVKIIDFGLAKSTQRSQETQANVLLGNFGYMSPEQARGQKLDVRTDVYSTGIVLFELVTGTKRFVDENPLRLLEMVARPTPIMPSDRAPDVPKALDRIFLGATQANREGRYKDAESFRDEVTQALHKLNPRATREHLAQFLNHLFLGGQAPPAVDNDALNKSVAIQVKDLHEKSSAFTKTKEDDVQDRGLTEFSDDAPQTGSHPLMRAARVGDVLSHQELTGDEALPPGVDPKVMESGPPPALRPPVQEMSASDISSPNVPAVMPAPNLHVQPPVALVSPTPEMTPPPSAAQSAWQARATDPAMRPPRADPSSLDEQPAVAEPGEHLPTEVYEAPTFAPSFGAPAFATDSLDLGGSPPDGELEELPLEEANDLLELTPLPPPQDPPATERKAPSGAQQKAPPPSVRSAPVVSQLGAPPPPAAAPPSQGSAVVSSVVERKGGAVVSTLKPSRDDPAVSERDEPTMVVDLGSLPGAEEREPLTSSSGAGFREGGAHDSLIIDFEIDDDPDAPTQKAPVAPSGPPVAAKPAAPAPSSSPPPAAPPSNVRPPAPVQPVIRPAAQPRGRVVTGGVAKPRRGQPSDVDPNKRR